MQAARYKLGLLAGKKRFTHMPEQLDDETYGTNSGAFGNDAQEACYVVRFVGRSQVEILGYVNMSGEVYRTCAPVKDAALPDVPDLVIRKSPDTAEYALYNKGQSFRICVFLQKPSPHKTGITSAC